MPPDYAPTDRRPIAGAFRKTADLAVRWCVRRGVHPNTVSYASVAASAVAAGCLLGARVAPWLLLAAPLFCYVRLWLNMLDGMVALASGAASRRGEVVNELPDRVSDVMVFAAVAASGLARPGLGYWAAIGALFTAYVGTLGRAAGARREFGGVMSKPWRMVALHLGCWATFGLLAAGRPTVGGLTGLDWACVVVIAGCVQTCVVRVRSTWRLLG